jgi:hypothetical protein
MSISIIASSPSVAPNADAITPRATAAARTPIESTQDGDASGSESGIASVQKEPVRHVPWLSRLTAQLDSSATQKSPFTAAPVTGETLNRSA